MRKEVGQHHGAGLFLCYTPQDEETQTKTAYTLNRNHYRVDWLSIFLDDSYPYLHLLLPLRYL